MGCEAFGLGAPAGYDLAATGRRLVVLDPQESTDDLVNDMADVLTSLCARLYGQRAGKNRAARALAAATVQEPSV